MLGLQIKAFSMLVVVLLIVDAVGFQGQYRTLVGGKIASYASVVRLAERAGVSAAEIVGVLVAVAPYIGIARTVSAAPELALAVGFDVDDLIERDRDGFRSSLREVTP